MKLRSAFIIVCVWMVVAACGGSNYDPSNWLSAEEYDKTMWRVIRYIGRAPENTTMAERFYDAYKEHYQEQISLHRLDAYFVDGDTHYFLISRRAPSLTEKRVATGGKMKLDTDGVVQEYEEVFRTWKQVDSTQMRKSVMLFDKMVKGESLEPYLTKNSQPEEYIEFPDDNVYFDKADRAWKTKSGVIDSAVVN